MPAERRAWRDSVFAHIQALTRSQGEAPGAGLPVGRMCTLAGVSRAACYRAWACSDPLREETALRDVVQRLALANRHYGYRRIGALLRREGWCVNHKRVVRIMREDNLLCLAKPLFRPPTTNSRHGWRVWPNLGRHLMPMATNQLWVPGTGKLSDVLLLIIAIVGTTVAPWQLFFQQSYVIDKRITPRFMAYEKADLWIGIVVVIIGAVAMMAFCAATFAGHPEAGNFTDAGGISAGLEKYVGAVPGTLFAIALIDASIIGASAVSLATAYALSDVLALKHSLHRKATDAKGFYLVYCGLIAAAATPGFGCRSTCYWKAQHRLSCRRRYD